MTTASPAPPPPAAGEHGETLRLSDLLKRPVADSGGETLGRLSDVIVRLGGPDYPQVVGAVVAIGGSRAVFVPLDQVSAFVGDRLKLTTPKLDLRQFERRDGEVLLSAEVLGHRLIDVHNARLVRAGDLQLSREGAEWVLSGVDTRRRSRRLFGLLGLGPTHDAMSAAAEGAAEGAAAADAEPVFRDWHDFESLIGHVRSELQRGPFARVRRLKPAQIADLLEDASKKEETEILGRVHADPELEADVFEELDEDRATRLLGARSDAEIAAVLGRMRADDAADAIAELPQPRRQPVLDLLPPGQRIKVLTLLGFNRTSAGGLMAMDFVAIPSMGKVSDALDAIRGSATLQPEALTSVHAVDDDGGLRGVARLVTLVQSDPARPLIEVCDTDPIRVGADADVMDVAVLMTDYNLITIPVVDHDSRLLGVITVDDVLEVTLPDEWRRREAAEPPDAHHGEAR